MALLLIREVALFYQREAEMLAAYRLPHLIRSPFMMSVSSCIRHADHRPCGAARPARSMIERPLTSQA